MSGPRDYPFFYAILLAWWFKGIVVPLVTAGITIFFKANSKPTLRFERNDWFICFELCVSAIFIFIIGMIDLVHQMVNAPSAEILALLDSPSMASVQDNAFQDQASTLSKLLTEQHDIIVEKFGLSWGMLTLIFLIVMTISAFVRMQGWENHNNNNDDGTAQLRVRNGIVLPNIVGLLILIAVASWIRV
ncbi:MAG: hypothetical protein AAFW84_24870 [Cyanobacteria bacterium J06635_15]